MRYADAGVDILRAEKAKQRIRTLAGRTFTREVLEPIGGFGALFSLNKRKWRDPVLVSSADGVGSKLTIAFATGVHSTVGADIVNHCINDILTSGAKPLFFLDYLAMGRIEPGVVEQLIEGMSRAAKQAGCALIGGETAELPDFYRAGEYDLAGFIVGAVEREKQLGAKRVRAGDLLFALPSAGLHTNGYALARKVIFETARLKAESYIPEIQNKAGAELLKPHRCYWPMLKEAIGRDWISAMAHITGGGLPGNLPRALPRNTQATVDLGAWPVPAMFQYLARVGKINPQEMLSTFNLGVGMVLVVPAKRAQRLENELRRRREHFHIIGHVRAVRAGEPRLVFTGHLGLN